MAQNLTFSCRHPHPCSAFRNLPCENVSSLFFRENVLSLFLLVRVLTRMHVACCRVKRTGRSTRLRGGCTSASTRSGPSTETTGRAKRCASARGRWRCTSSTRCGHEIRCFETAREGVRGGSCEAEKTVSKRGHVSFSGTVGSGNMRAGLDYYRTDCPGKYFRHLKSALVGCIELRGAAAIESCRICFAVAAGSSSG